MMRHDPLLRATTLEYETTLPVLGIETRFETNSAAVMDVVDESFGRWRQVHDATHCGTQSVRVRVVVSDGREESTSRSPITHVSGPGKRLVLQSHGSIGVVDPLRRESIAFVTSELVDDRANFRVAMLEAITLALLACFDRHPVHAAAITRGERTALLAGPSGSGKSTLAYLAHSAGIHVLSDDHVWVQTEPDCRIWGSAPHARLLSESAAHFPEVVHTGSEKVVVPLRPHEETHRLIAHEPVVCVLSRGERAMLEPIPSDEVESELVQQLTPGFDRFPERNADVVRRISQRGGWRLTLSGNPHDALPLLNRVIDGNWP
ncbi:MAG: hypothetical protein ABJE10_05100 [bacterium]